MTEEEWLVSEKPRRMLYQIRESISDRKMRLYSCACVWRESASLSAGHVADALRVAEAFADGAVADEDRQAAAEVAYDRANRHGISSLDRVHLVNHAAARTLNEDASSTRRVLDFLRESISTTSHAEQEWTVYCNLLRDIFGNPFRPVAFDPAWRTATAVAVAEGVYAEKAFDRLPILADALQDAGCEDAAVLGHLRGDGPHVRGCWTLDLVLGKE